ncbi:MAG: DUF3667 domain-containing protein [Flavobacteriaceae bacterium]|nr:DUF3667 domain-containing protein [Flavobacteriaceae bacterium]
MSKCKNCNTELISDFCHQCGQRSAVYKVTFKETFQDFVDVTFSINAPLINTTLLLFSNPGIVFREYLNGRRKSFYKPVSFFIITTFIYIILRSIIDYNPLTPEGVKVGGELLIEAGQYMVKNINNIMFLFVFTFGIFLKIFFWKKYSLAEYIAVAFYAMGIYTILGTILMFYLKYFNSGFKMLPVILFYFYMLYAISNFFQSKSFFTFIKISFVYLFSFVLYSGIGFLLSFLIVWLRSK